MATNYGPFSVDDNTSERGQSMLRTALGLSPLGFGMFAALQGFNADGGVSNPLKSGGALRGLGTATGGAARSSKRDHGQQAERVRSALQKSLSDSAEMQKIINNLDSHNALLHTMSVAIEDPAFGIDTTKVQSLKHEIQTAMSNLVPEGTAADLIERVSRSILDSSDADGMVKWGQYMSEFDGVKGIQAPNFRIAKSGSAFAPIKVGALSDTESGLATRLQNALGSKHKLKFIEHIEFGQRNVIAQVFSPGKSGRWKSNIPLSMTGKEPGGLFFRSGEMGQTLYAAPRKVIHLPTAYGIEQRLGKPAFSKQGIDAMGPATGTWSSHRVDEAVEAARGSGGYVDWKVFNADQLAQMTNVNRAATGMTGPVGSHLNMVGGHVLKQARMKMNVYPGIGSGLLPSNDRIPFIARLSTSYGYDGGIGGKRTISGFGDQQQVTIGILDGSPLSYLSRAYGVGREEVPITLREHQIIGRTTMFTDPIQRIGHAGNMAIGGTAQHLEHNVGWGNAVTGALNKAMVVDFRMGEGDFGRALAGTGMGWTGTSHSSFRIQDFNILDPKTHGYGASELLRRLHAEGTDGSIFAKPNEPAYLGQSGGKAKMLRRDARNAGVHLMIDRTAPVAGKDMVYLKAVQDQTAGLVKVFGLSIKGNLERVGATAIRGIQRGDIASDIARLMPGVSPMKVGYVASDSFKKGAVGFVHQIASSARLVGGINTEALSKAATALGSNAGFELGGSAQARYAVAATSMLANVPGLTHRGHDIGMVLAGVYQGAGGKGEDAHGLNRTNLLNMVKSKLTAKDFKAAKASMKMGLGFMVDTLQQGESAGDRGQGRMGAEARFAKGLHERLVTMGMSVDDASSMVGNVYKTKIGFANQFELSKEMLGMVQSLTGSRSPLSLMNEDGVQKMSYNKLIETLGGKDVNGLMGLLKSEGFEKGLLLDFTDADTQIARAAKQVFSQGEIKLPGGNMIRLARGTDIRQAGGKTLAIDSAYGGLMNSLEERLVSISSDQTNAAKMLKEWKDQGTTLFSQMYNKLFSGKMKGSSTPTAMMYDLNEGFGMTERARKVGLGLFQKTSGTNVHLNAEGFVSMLTDSTHSKADKAWQAKAFFTSLEGNGHAGTTISKAKGIVSISTRQPHMSSGNIFVSETFRSLHEISGLGGEDEFFKKMTGADFVKSARYKNKKGMLKPVRSFTDVSRMSGGAQRDFFSSMIDNLSDFTGGAGGGVIHIPKLMANRGGKDVDIGLFGQAFGDNDGDNVNHIMLSKEDRKKVLGLIGGDSPDDFNFRAFVSEISGEIKGGMDNFSKNMASSLGENTENALKEIALSQETGRLDVALRPLHDALMNYGDGGAAQKQQRALLGALQEHVILKSKKLPAYTPLAGMLGNAVKHLMGTGDINPLEDVLRNDIFRGTKIAEGGSIGGGSFQAAEGSTAAAQKMVSSIGASGGGFNLDDTLATFKQVAQQQRKYGGGEMTEGQMSAAFKKSMGGSIIDELHQAVDMISASTKAYNPTIEHSAASTSRAMGQITETLGKLDRRAAAPIALGLMGSSIAMGVLGDQGYGSEPIMMPGEMPNPKIDQAVAGGNLFSYGSAPGTEHLSHRQDQYAMMNTPMNMGTMYASRPNAYQIRGEVSSPHGLSQLSGYLQRATGGLVGGSLMVNDTRRPITSAYTDRLLGEY